MNVKYLITIEIEMNEKQPDWKDVKIIDEESIKIFEIEKLNIAHLVKKLERVCKKFLIKGDKAHFTVDVSEMSLKDHLN